MTDLDSSPVSRSTAHVRWPRVWLERGPVAWALRPVAWVYGGLWWLRSLLYRCAWFSSHKLPVPVVVVGNVVVGGAGKTPTVIGLVQHLQAQGWHPGVVSRGYGRQGPGVLAVRPHTPSAQAGDEPVLIAQRTGVPVFVGAQRVAVAQALLAQHPHVNVLVSDDGMQHWRLQRDLTVVVFDERGTGNGWLLPAGLLREPWPAAPWGPGPMLVLHYDGRGQALAPATPQGVVYCASKRLASHAVDASGTPHALPQPPHATGAVAGIAQPERFFGMLQDQGVALHCTLALPDHASATVLTQALHTAQQQHPHITHWLCTEKDAVKLWGTPMPPHWPAVWAVPLQADWPAAFWHAVDAALAPRRG